MTRHGLCFAIFVFALQLPLGDTCGPSRRGRHASDRRSQLSDFVQCGLAEGVRPRCLDLALVLYPEALKGFTDIATAEPGCAMAYWGIAMSHWYPLWYPPNAAALKAVSIGVQVYPGSASNVDPF